MLKKLAVALVVAAISVTGMTASAALALRITGPHGPADLYEGLGRVGEDEPNPHAWDEPCAIAETEAEVVVDLGGLGSVRTFDDDARELIGIEVRLLATLRDRSRPHSRTERALLRSLHRSIEGDRRSLDRFVRMPTEAQLEGWITDSLRRNARMAKLSRKLRAHACAEYFGN